AEDGRRPEVESPADQGGREVAAQHEEGPVGEVGNPHEAEDEREAGRQEKEQAAQGDAVDGQHEPEIHGGGAPRIPGRSPTVRWAPSSSAGDSRASRRAGRETTSRRRSRTGSRWDRS